MKFTASALAALAATSSVRASPYLDVTSNLADLSLRSVPDQNCRKSHPLNARTHHLNPCRRPRDRRKESSRLLTVGQLEHRSGDMRFWISRRLLRQNHVCEQSRPPPRGRYRRQRNRPVSRVRGARLHGIVFETYVLSPASWSPSTQLVALPSSACEGACLAPTKERADLLYSNRAMRELLPRVVRHPVPSDSQ